MPHKTRGCRKEATGEKSSVLLSFIFVLGKLYRENQIQTIQNPRTCKRSHTNFTKPGKKSGALLWIKFVLGDLLHIQVTATF